MGRCQWKHFNFCKKLTKKMFVFDAFWMVSALSGASFQLQENVPCICDIIHASHKLTITKVANDVGISLGSCQNSLIRLHHYQNSLIRLHQWQDSLIRLHHWQDSLIRLHHWQVTHLLLEWWIEVHQNENLRDHKKEAAQLNVKVMIISFDSHKTVPCEWIPSD